MIKIHQIISQKTKMCRGKEDEILDDEIISIDENNDGVIDITYSSDNTIDLIDYVNDNDLNINHNDESYSIGHRNEDLLNNTIYIEVQSSTIEIIDLTSIGEDNANESNNDKDSGELLINEENDMSSIIVLSSDNEDNV